MKQKVAFLLDHPGHFDSRVMREAKILQDEGYDVKVFCLNKDKTAISYTQCGIDYVQCFKDQTTNIPVVSKLFHVLRKRLRKNNPDQQLGLQNDPAISIRFHELSFVRKAAHLLGLFFSFSHNFRAFSLAVKHFSPDVIHAHDLSTLYAGVKLSRLLRAKIIYDSHEYERSRNTQLSVWEHKIRMGSERRNIARVDRIITVSDSIADRLVEDYDVARPLVYINVPFLQKELPKGDVTTIARQDYDLPAGAVIGIYIGALSRGRGLEEALLALAQIKDIHLVILGGRPGARLEELRSHADNCGVTERVHFIESVLEVELQKILRLCDFSWIPIQYTCESYNFALPNKLFQSHEAGLPVFATPLLEISRFVRHFNIGLIAKSFDSLSQADSLRTFITGLEAGKPVLKNEDELCEYSYVRMRDRYLKLYKSLASGQSYRSPARLPHMKR